MARRILWLACLSIACAALVSSLSGCGGDGIVRHQVSGKVTFREQPVEYGTIAFEPEASVGQIAPSSFVRIEHGAYQTAKGDGPTTGKYKVRVMGFDTSKMKKNTPPEEIIETPELFPAYTLSVEIPPPGGKLDIEVPNSGRPR